ncbi:MAG TPA: hypothetical protein VHR66_23830 [Gemmataceae bacterium]|nr:hypothetical protein [Gemmataceae bacterium]
MTHVSIDRQPEAVKQFFESLALTSEGSVVEMNGRAMARMLYHRRLMAINEFIVGHRRAFAAENW